MMDLVYLVGPARVYARQVAVLAAPDLLALISGPVYANDELPHELVAGRLRL
jgi:hypothetical protein